MPSKYKQLSHPTYRPDIDGLRAIAVLSVVIFHAFPKYLAGGFIGVDIFFVISGFLISTIIISNLERESFSFIEFYCRRIQRIFPALLTVLFAIYVFGWLALFTEDYKYLGKHIAGGAGFISNYLLWNESGYFDHASEIKPLLHLWSLGIEEQFYIVWPLTLYLAWKAKFNLFLITISIAVISFILNLGKVHSDAIATFYSPQTRFWELLVGCLLAYMKLHGQNILPSIVNKIFFWSARVFNTSTAEINIKTIQNFQSAIGIALIFSGLIIITKERHFPGGWAILPTLGTLMIISAGANSWINRTVLSNRLLVWFGLISFPLYLWHWPLLSLARILQGEAPLGYVKILIMIISIILAWLTYKLIETPVRFGSVNKTKIITLISLMFLVGYLGFITYIKDGLHFRPIAKMVEGYTKTIEVSARNGCVDLPFGYKKNGGWFCQIGDESSANIFVYGDSHAYSLLPALEKLSFENNINILFASSSGCLPLLGVEVDRGTDWLEKYNCPKLNDKIFEYVRAHGIKNVFLISYWTYYDKSNVIPARDNVHQLTEKEASAKNWQGGAWYYYGINNTVKKYKEIGVNLYIFEDNPTQLYSPNDALKKAQRPVSDMSINKFSILKDAHKHRQAYVTNEFKDISGDFATVVNFDKLLCEHEICPLVIDGKFMYADIHHLSKSGAMVVYPEIKKILPSLKN